MSNPMSGLAKMIIQPNSATHTDNTQHNVDHAPDTPINDYYIKKRFDDIAYSTSMTYTVDSEGRLGSRVEEEFVIPEHHRLMIELEFKRVMLHHGFNVVDDDTDSSLFEIKSCHNPWSMIIARQSIIMFTDVTIQAIKNCYEVDGNKYKAMY